MLSFLDYCKQHIIDEIDSFEGQEVYASDLGIILTEGINSDGTVTASRSKAIEYIQLWWDDCAEYWEYEKMSFGKNYHNPFDNPEAYMVCMVIEGVYSILSKCDLIEENWNGKIELNEENIASIKDFVEEFYADSLF